jgi:hypothetical protein
MQIACICYKRALHLHPRQLFHGLREPMHGRQFSHRGYKKHGASRCRSLVPERTFAAAAAQIRKASETAGRRRRN